jgi:hypothetical protein
VVQSDGALVFSVSFGEDSRNKSGRSPRGGRFNFQDLAARSVHRRLFFGTVFTAAATGSGRR